MAVGLVGCAAPVEHGAQQRGAVAIERIERHGGGEAREHCDRRAEQLGFGLGREVWAGAEKLGFGLRRGFGLRFGLTCGRRLQVRGVDGAEGQEEDTRAEQHADEVVVQGGRA